MNYCKVKIVEYGFNILTSYTTYEHVPAKWQIGHSLISIYSLSCFLYCITGFTIMTMSLQTPEYFEMEESLIWIWQGLIAFISDAYYLGKNSISHPIDRISALIVTFLLMRKYLTISGILCCHPHYNIICENDNNSIFLKIELLIGLFYSFFCLYNSSIGYRNNNKYQYFTYHTLWHTGFPLTVLGFHIILLKIEK